MTTHALTSQAGNGTLARIPTRPRLAAYWAASSLLALAMLLGGVADIVGVPEISATMVHLGYPAYFLAILGVWKILGGFAVLAPRFTRLKEWAYAGIAFDLSGAAISHLATGDGLGKALGPLILLGIALASWALRPASRKLQSRAAT